MRKITAQHSMFKVALAAGIGRKGKEAGSRTSNAERRTLNVDSTLQQRQIGKGGDCRRIHFLGRPQLSDHKDDHILELAIAADGADIVTHNVNDFSQSSVFEVRIITPAKLLGELK